MKFLSFVMLWAAVCTVYASPSPSPWFLAQDSNLQVYAQSGKGEAVDALRWFEQLRSFFGQNGILESKVNADGRAPIRVIGFHGQKEYLSFRLRRSADAYYVGDGSQDYIVLPGLSAKQFGIATHEYVHSVTHATGLKLPFWLNEGLAEFFSTVRRSGTEWEFGGTLPGRVDTLRRHQPFPLTELLALQPDSRLLETRTGSAMFYAESWALTNFLITSDNYRPLLGKFVNAVNGGVSSTSALLQTFGKPPADVQSECLSWILHRKSKPLRIAIGALPTDPTDLREVSQPALDKVLAGLLLADGDLDRAEATYKRIAAWHSDPDISAALGTIALRRGDQTTALQLWSQAIHEGIKDANLCYRFAIIADLKNASETETRRALERAIQLKPDFDDARYRLALIESNAGNYEAALEQLDAMRHISPERQFNFWATKAYALTELDRRTEGKAAADEALRHAADASERSRAAELAYLADTDVAVRFAQDAYGQMRLVETRVPHGSQDWNPFIEPGDKISRAEGTLRDVECADGKLTGFSLNIDGRTLRLVVPDPQRVQMRNSPTEFTCGPQPAKSVIVEYAANGVLRGMEFR